LVDAYEATLQGWVHALELREHETADHSRRVVELTRRMALEFGFSGESLALIQRGALLHDIGKIGVPDSILLKPGPLTPEEWTIMRYHPRFAYDLLAQIPYLQRSVDIPYCHHERWDGSGYPRGIAKEKIPLSARIFAVVDVFDALLSDRPYRPAWSLPDVIRYLIDQKGKQFDPLIVDCFLAMIEKEKAREDGTPTIEKQPQS
jgi:HD-GYP domain-containing protein (c-di-GMP phosphodiesterase class II)